MARWRDIALAASAGLEGMAGLAAIEGDAPVALALHAASCGALALGLHGRLVRGAAGLVLLLATALLVPALGALGLAAAALLAPPVAEDAEPDVVLTPIPGAAAVPVIQAPGCGPASATTAAARVAAARRRSDPGCIAMLRRALHDRDDDVRLVAHALLEKKTRAAYRNIHDAAGALEAAPSGGRARMQRRLAERCWEMAWLGLAQGECLGHALETARRHALAALEAEPACAALHLLLARIELRRGEAASAEAALAHAARLGVPAAVVEPYLAEAAFLARRWDRVRERLARAATGGGGTVAGRLQEYWS